jgi:hypothetical protein
VATVGENTNIASEDHCIRAGDLQSDNDLFCRAY